MDSELKAYLTQQLGELIIEQSRIAPAIEEEKLKPIPNDLILFKMKRDLQALHKQITEIKLKLDPDIVA
jgi:hypothetical protein